MMDHEQVCEIEDEIDTAIASVIQKISKALNHLN
jgi:hypothetical protein